MDFADSPQEAAIRAEARAWLESNAPRYSGPVRSESEGLGRAKAWQAAKAAAGWACIRWPREYGGRGGSAMEEIVFGQEESKFDLPAGFPRHRPAHLRRRDPRLRHARSRSAASCRRSRAARRCGASSSPSRARAPTSPGCAPAPSATATSGWCRDRRCGTRARTTPTGRSWSRAATPRCRSTRASCSSRST